MRIIDFNPELHNITFTNKQETVLTDLNIMLLKRMFKTPEKYEYYMKVLWLLRSLTEKKCCKDGMIDSNDEVYPIFRLANELIGSLLREDTFFDSEGNLMQGFNPNMMKTAM